MELLKQAVIFNLCPSFIFTSEKKKRRDPERKRVKIDQKFNKTQ